MFHFSNQQLHFEKDKTSLHVCFVTSYNHVQEAPNNSEKPKFPLPLENIIFLMSSI